VPVVPFTYLRAKSMRTDSRRAQVSVALCPPKIKSKAFLSNAKGHNNAVIGLERRQSRCAGRTDALDLCGVSATSHPGFDPRESPSPECSQCIACPLRRVRSTKLSSCRSRRQGRSLISLIDYVMGVVHDGRLRSQELGLFFVFRDARIGLQFSRRIL